MDAQDIVLIVDDTPENLHVLGEMLEQEGCQVRVATNGQQALQIARASSPDLILLDIMMPGMDGYEVCRQLKADTTTCDIPVIFLTALANPDDEAKGLGLGAVDYIAKPFKVELVRTRVHTQVELKKYRDDLKAQVRQQTLKLILAKEATIASMAILAEFRDQETGGHIQRTKHYVKVLAEQLNRSLAAPLNPEEIELLFQSVPLHDIGKVGTPDAILLKPGRLTEAEFEEMKKHTLFGSEAIKRTEAILGSSSFLQYARELTEFHHEKWDGSGYPHGLRRQEIPLSARLMALADIYDALISRRPYKEPLSHEEAYRIITDGDGRTMPEHFDPDVLAAFAQTHLELQRIAKEFLG